MQWKQFYTLLVTVHYIRAKRLFLVPTACYRLMWECNSNSPLLSLKRCPLGLKYGWNLTDICKSRLSIALKTYQMLYLIQEFLKK